ncbi:MAG: hypothetical protein Q7S48_00230 [bacterium]|nr:hypothetical protein [bacterium]
MAAVRKQNKPEEVQISLLPDQNGKMGAETRVRVICIVIFAVLIVSIAVSSILLRVRAETYQDQTSRLEESTTFVRASLQEETKKAQEFGNLGQRAGVAKSVLENHVASEKALAFLEASTIPEITLNQLAFDGSGSLVLSGQGTQFSAISRQLQSWKEHPLVKEVTMSGISVAIDQIGNVEGVDFTSTITLDKEALRFEP